MIRLATAHRGALGLLAGLVLSASLLVSAVPRALEASFDAGVREVLTKSSPIAKALEVGWRGKFGESVAEVTASDALWRGMLPAAVREVADPEPLVRFSTVDPMRIDGRPGHLLFLRWVDSVDTRIRYVRGTPPGPRRDNRFQIALSAAVAAELKIEVGDTLRFGEYTAQVTGIFEPLNPTAAVWTHNPQLTSVYKMRSRDGDDEMWVTGLTHGASLSKAEFSLAYAWTIPVDPAKLTTRNAEAVLSGISAFKRQIKDAGASIMTSLDLSLSWYLKLLSTTRALISILLGGLAVVGLGTIALAVRLLADRMRAHLALMRARGASLPRITAATGTVTALAAGPAAAAGYVGGSLVPGPATPPVHLGPPLLALAAVVFTCVWTALAHRQPPREQRDDIAAARPSPRRIALEALVITLGLIGVYLLRARGLGTGDPLVVLAPPMLALAAGLVIIRVYPLPLRSLVRLAAGRRGASPYLGLAMAARSSTGAALPVLTLLPALAIGAYGMATADGLVTARQLAAWQSVGAEIRVEREEGIPPDLVERIRRAVDAGGSHGRDIVPAAIGHVTAEVGYGGIPAIVAAIDLDAYRRLLQGTPLAGSIPAPPTAGTAGTGTTTATPALVSTDLAGMPSFEIDWPERLTVATRGVISSLPGVSTGDAALIVIPAMPEHTNRLFMSGDATAVRAVAPPGTLVTTLEEAADQIPGAPLASALVTGLRTVALALVCYALIAAAIAFVARGPERSRTLRLLGTLGLTTGQARVLTVLEVTPLLLLTTCAGVALGIGLPQLLGPAIELSAFTGPEANGQPFISVSSALWPAAGVILIALTGAYLGGNRARSG